MQNRIDEILRSARPRRYQKELAELADVNPGRLSLIVNDQAQPTGEQVFRIVDGLQKLTGRKDLSSDFVFKRDCKKERALGVG